MLLHGLLNENYGFSSQGILNIHCLAAFTFHHLQELPNGQDLTVDLYEGEVMAVGKEADRLEEVFAALKAQVNVRASRKKKDGDS